MGVAVTVVLVVAAVQKARSPLARTVSLLSGWSQDKSVDLAPDDMSRLQDYFIDVLRSKKPLLSNPVALNEFRLFEQQAQGH